MLINKDIDKVRAIELADYILNGWGPMSHLKLQKLLYYCQAYHLAYFEKELFEEDFEAWMHGPVCREVYNEVKGASVLYSEVSYVGDDPVPIVENKLNLTQLDLIKETLNELSKWTGLELENATHQEQPWVEARKGYGNADKCTSIISKELMKTYYKSEIDKEA